MNYNDSRMVLGLSLMLFSSCFFVGMTEGEDGWSQAIGGFLQGVKDGHDAATEQVANTKDSLPCMKSLIPCQLFLHSSTPPPVCCMPLQDVVEHDPQCLCTVFKNNELLKTFNLTQEDALALPKACGITANASFCNQEPGSPGSPGNSSTTPPSPPSTTPATPSTTPASGNGTQPTEKPDDDNAAPAITNVGIHFIASLVALIISAAF